VNILWRRIDTPGHDSARLVQRASGWNIVGTAVFLFEGQACWLNYLIVCDLDWSTHSARVDGWVGERAIDVNISASRDHTWSLNDVACPDVEGCVDVDLNFSPITNTLPIRRLNLEVGHEAEVHAAWLRFPTFNLERLEQIYRRTGPLTYRYNSAGGSFIRELQVNEAGLVTSYPDFFELETLLA
jgi:hypothetical protein